MYARFNLPRLLLVAVALLLLGGCGNDRQAGQDFQWLPVFGGFAKDNTPIVATVGDITITERDLQFFVEEQPSESRSRFKGPEGERLALKAMIDQAVAVQEAIAREVYQDPRVARNLIALRRNTLAYAMRNVGLKDRMEPSEEQLRQYYLDNKSNYRNLGRVQARHIECMREEDARRAYDRLVAGGPKSEFPYVVKDFSTNAETRAQEGELGWFSKGGVIPYVADSTSLIDAIYDLDTGLHPPIEVGDRWHVVEIARRVEERPQTFTEARGHVYNDMLPAFKEAVYDDFLAEMRQKYGVDLVGKFAPGQGLTPDQLFARAMAVADPQNKVDLLLMLYEDFPQSPKADDALFMAAYASLEVYVDKRVADRLLLKLVNEYPDSKLVPDAKFLRDNLYNPEKLDPKTIEDLREGR